MMQNLKKLLLVCLTVMLTVLGADNVWAAPLPTISIVGFANKVEESNLTQEQMANISIVNDYLADEFINSGKVDVYDLSPEVTKRRIDEVAAELELGDGQTPVLKMINSEYIVYGYVRQLSAVESVAGLNNMAGSAIDGRSKTVTASLSAMIVETGTGKHLLTVTGEGKSGNNKVGVASGLDKLGVGKDGGIEACIHNALAEAAHQLAEKILNAA